MVVMCVCVEENRVKITHKKSLKRQTNSFGKNHLHNHTAIGELILFITVEPDVYLWLKFHECFMSEVVCKV